MKKAITLILILTMALALACSNNQKPVENTPSPTSTVSETPVLPTESPTEVPTAEPTATPEPTPLPSTLTYEERIALDKIDVSFMVHLYTPVENTLDATYATYGTDGFIASCEVLSVKFYIGWGYGLAYSLVDGYTITEARVIEVQEEYNDAGIKPGDTVTFMSFSYIIAPNADMFPLIAEELNTPIESKEDYYELKKNVPKFAMEFPIERGRHYAYYVAHYDFPMKEGERYTLMGRALGEDRYKPSLIYPASYELDVAAFAKEHDFVYDAESYLKMAKEIAAMFK